MDPTEEMLPGEIELSWEQRNAIQQRLDARDAAMQQESQPTIDQAPTPQPTEQLVEQTEVEPQPEEVEQINNEPFLKLGNETLPEIATKNLKRKQAVFAGLVDFGVDAINMLTGVSPEQDAEYGGSGGLKKSPKFEDDVSQSIREISSIVLPNVILSGGLGAAVKANKAVQASKFLSDPLVKFVGERALNAGIGAGVDYTASVNREGDNLAGTLKKTWPRSTGWIPDNIATLDSDSPDVKRNKSLQEGVLIGTGIDLLESVASLAKAATKSKAKWVPSTEKAKEWFGKNNKVQVSPEQITETNAAAREANLDELGAYNFSQSKNLDEPILGVHDMYGYREVGSRGVDNLGIVGASVDVVRVSENLDSVYGRVGSVLTEPAIKFAISDTTDPKAAEIIVRGLTNQLQEAGEYGYQTSKKLISHKEIVEKGDLLAASLYGKPLAQLKEALVPFLQQPDQYGIRQLNDEAYAGVFKMIKQSLSDYENMDYVRATAYLETSLGGQVSDMAEGIRLMDGTEAVARGQEQVLDRLEFLMQVKGQTSYSRGRALNATNLWNRMSTFGSDANKKAQATYAKRLLADEENGTLKALERIKQDAKGTIDTLRAVKAEKPSMLPPLMLAYEMTDGNIDSITKLNKYINNTTGVFSKAILDLNPDLPSAYLRGFWSNVYNSTLSAFGTPIKAGISNGFLLASRPINTLAGGLMHRDMATLQRGWYQYSSALDTLNKGMDYMKKVWSKAGIDPSVVDARESYQIKNDGQLEILERYADAMAMEGNYGAQAMVSIIREQEDMAKHPWLRFGTRSMQAFDGFTQAVVGNWEARGEAFDKITNGGARLLNGKDIDQIGSEVYAKMFNKEGILTDKATKYAAGEIAFNLNNGANDGLSELIKKAPVLKPFLLFTKTPLNAIAYTSTANPLGAFINEFNQFQKPFAEMDGPRVAELLDKRNIRYDASNVEAKYANLRAEFKGRKAMGMLTVTSAASLFMNDRVTGNGLYDLQKQKGRREYGWKPRSIKGPDGNWYSYDNLGAFSDWMAMTVDIMDNGLDFGRSGKGVMRPNDIGENLRAMGFVIAASVVDKAGLSALEPLLDVARGDVGAINRFSAGFLSSALTPGASQMAEIARVMQPQLKIVDNNLQSLIMNRNPLTKGALPNRNDWINGGAVNEPTNFFTRLWNGYTPFKTNGAPSDEAQFLIDVGYDGIPSLQSNGNGAKYTPEEQSEVTSIMGREGLFRDKIKEIMQSTSAKEFRATYYEAQSKGLPVDVRTIDGLHDLLDDALKQAKNQAEGLLSNSNDVQQRGALNRLLDNELNQGNIKAASATQQLIQNR